MRRLHPPPQPEAAPDEDTPRGLDETHVALRDLLSERRISPEIYYKNVVALAMRWIAIGRIEDARGMVCELTDEYVAKVMPQQMRLDDDFRKVALGVALRLGDNLIKMDADDVALATMLLEKPVAKA